MFDFSWSIVVAPIMFDVTKGREVTKARALAFVTSRPFVTSNIIGATTIDQLKSNIDSIAVRITPEIEQRINEIHQLHSNPAP